MSNFEPAGIIHLGRVPFDNSYRHTIDCFTEETQASVMQGFMKRSLSRNDYTYVRKGSSIRVPYNAEELYTFNYCMYQNANYGTKWFYCFITDILYINDNCTELVLQLDVLQTWWYDWTLKECMVEREHVRDDRIGYNNIAEPPMDLEWMTEESETETVNADYAVFLVSAYPHSNTNGTHDQDPNFPDWLKFSGSDPVSGAIYHNQYSAAKYLIYDLNDDASVSQMGKDIKTFNAVGAADAIVDCFTFDKRWLPSSQLRTFLTSNPDALITPGNLSTEIEHAYQLKSGQSPHTASYALTRVRDFGGYVPRNNKLFTFPYTYAQITNPLGASMQFRYEFAHIEDFAQGRIEFHAMAPLCPDSSIFIWSPGYNGTDIHLPNDHVFTVGCSNRISWTYSAYQTWAAQNALTNQLAVGTGLATLAMNVIPGIGAATSVLGKGATLPGKHVGAISKGAKASMALDAYNDTVNQQEMNAAGMDLGSFLGTYSKMKLTPNEPRGNVAGNAPFQTGFLGFTLANVRLRAEWAKVVDDFFTMYGYAVDRCKKPELYSRKAFNYVKCQNSCNTGNVPAPDMAMINSIFDSGLTVWHTSDVGNYDADNSIV